MGEFEVGQLAQELHTGFLAYAATMQVLEEPEIFFAVERLRHENVGPAAMPIGSIPRSDGSEIFYDFSHALVNIRQSREYRARASQLWIAGAIITLGDALDAASYFDRGPDLELIRHLRNGVAHGNHFDLRHGEPRRPAHFTGPDQRFLQTGDTPAGEGLYFEVTASSAGDPVLFEFMGPGDVLDLLMFVSWRLIRVGNGDPPHELFAQR